jgi:membrane-bound lytic murein transglycosylase D
MVEQILAEEGVPDELKYLAMVESALNPRARSHAGAAGMWQFIPATGRAYGLRVTREVDDRLNPEKATRAAARHLRDLYERFGDWHLALAGYNCNPAVIARAVRRVQDRTGRRATFWDIYNNIPRETRNYVPMFIATSLVVSNPTAYGLPTGEQGSRYVFDQIPVEGGTSLSAIARVLDIDAEAIRALNPSIRRSRVPTQRDPWMLRIPSGYQNLHADDLARFAPATARNNTRYAARTVHYGSRAIRPLAVSEPNTSTALRNPTTTVAVATRTGRARTPAPQPVTTNAPPPVRTVADAARSNTSSQAVPLSSNSSSSTPPRNRNHRVQRGENLTLIARRYGVTVNQIVNENSLRSTTIRIGQRLRINANASRARTSVTSNNGPRTVRHRVRRGENLSVIARRYGVTVRQIMNWNSLRSTTIRPGQRLRIQTRRNVG